MSRARMALASLALLSACAGAGPNAPVKGPDDLAERFVAAFDEEAKGDPQAARKMYLDLALRAAGAADTPWQAAALHASLDALVTRSVAAFGDVSASTALAYRMPESDATIRGALDATYKAAAGPYARGMVARALLDLYEHSGDAAPAALWRERTGCAREATIIGPLDWAPVTGVRAQDPLEAFDAKLAGSYASRGAFALSAAPVVARGHGCAIDLSAPRSLAGVRDVVVDVDVARAGRIGVAFRTRGEATLRVGGKLVLSRAYALGGEMVARYGRVDVGAGKVRVVARVGMGEDGESVEIDAWDEQGAPLPMRAPRVGDAASVRVESAEAAVLPAPKTDAERALAAASALAEGDGRTAEHLLEGAAKSAPPDLTLLYARAVETAEDLSRVERSERARSAYERVLEAWPTAWEAIVAHAVLAGVRRGEGDARIETLKDLDERRAKATGATLPLLDAFDAATSGEERLYDRAHAAYERAKAALDPSSLLVDVAKVAIERVGADQAAFLCSPLAPHDRRTLECYAALRGKGDLPAAGRELERLRALRGGEDLYLSLALKDAIARGDGDRAARALADMSPGEVTLSDIYAVADLAAHGSPERAGRLQDAVTIARDSPGAWPALLRALGDDPTLSFAGVAEALLHEDRATPILGNAATAVLAHSERYEVDKTGLVHALLFDVRRVSGTTDVEENAQADPPDLLGHSTTRPLRRRILKRDGRIVEPDPTPRASQGHADLSQLEAGDLVEAIYEGWAIPNESGNVGFDTPDILPERTSVHKGTIQIELPRGMAGSLWSHPLLGKPAESIDGDKRILVYRMTDQPSRRVEEGTPKMDRSVGVSFTTLKWSEVGEGIGEVLASLSDDDPEIGVWAQKAVASAGEDPRAKVAAVVLASGTTVKEASASVLTDLAALRAGGPQSLTARTILTNHEGSRTWLIVQALNDLGIRADVVIAENDPFSEYQDFPPHVGRFLHPLAVAHLTGPSGAEELVWIDADVPGPPLPAGRISPELRGRSAIHVDGSVTPLPITSGENDADEVDLRLTIAPNGDAKGVFTVILRGREAQEIAEMLLRVVGDERQKALRNVALAWVPFADVDDVKLSSSEGSWQIAVRADLTILSYAEPEGGGTSAAPRWLLPGIDPLHVVYPRAFSGTLGATYAAQGKRQSALAVSHAVQYHAHRRIELPKGAKITTLPGPLEVKTARLEASRKITVTGSVIEDDFVLGVPTGTIAPSDYDAFAATLHRTDDAFLAGTHVQAGP
jgi:tetratricopeptide (TPR) repeat protein